MESNLKVFGNPQTFAIRYLPCPEEFHYERPEKYAICHLVINDVIIGNPTEECYLPTWFSQLNRNKIFIRENKNDLYPKDFVNLTDREIFEIIIKTNELEEDFDTSFLYLPQLNTEIWHRHTFHLDETIDAFQICYYIFDDNIKFIIEKMWPKSKIRPQDNFIYATISLNEFFSEIDNTTKFLEVAYPYLSDTSSSSLQPR